MANAVSSANTAVQRPAVMATLSWACITAPASGSSAVDSRIPFVAELTTGLARPLRMIEMALEVDRIEGATIVEHTVALLHEGSDVDGVALVDCALHPVIDAQSPIGRYRLSGTLLVQPLLESAGDANLHLGLTLVLRGDGLLTVSERVSLTVFPRHTWFDARGGFSYPAGNTECGDSLLLEGWAVRRSDRLARVDISLGDVLIGGASIGLSSPREHENFPVEDASKSCRFALWAKRSDVVQKLGGGESLLHGAPLSARCEFESGVTLRLAGPQLRSLPEAEQPRGTIESVREVREGLIEIGGYLLHGDLLPWSFYLEGRAWRLPLTAGRELEYTAAPAAEAQWPTWTCGKPCGFRVTVHPAALGRYPGHVRLVAESPDRARRVEFGPREMCGVLSALMERALHRDSFSERIKARMSSLLCGAGFRRSYPLAKLPRPAQADLPRRMVIASHNLSAVEGAPKALLVALEGLLAAGIPADGIRVVSGADGELRGRIEALGVTVDLRPEFHSVERDWPEFHRGVAQFAEDYREWNPDFVLANVLDSFWAIEYAHRCRIPSLFWIHESIAPFAWLPNIEPRLRILFFERLRSTATVFVAASTRQLFRPVIGHRRSWLVTNSVDVRAIEKVAESLDREAIRRSFGLNDRFVISIVGTTTWRKGQDVMLRELAAMRAARPEVPLHLQLVGARDLPFLEELIELVEELGLHDCVSIVAETPDVARYYVASDVIAIPSREESSPLVTLEAFAFNRPVVATSVFGLAEQLEGGTNALLVSLQEPGSIAKAIFQLYDRPELCEYLVAGGRESLARFSVEASHRGIVAAVRGTLSEYSSR